MCFEDDCAPESPERRSFLTGADYLAAQLSWRRTVEFPNKHLKQ